MATIVSLGEGVLAFIGPGYTADCDHGTCAEAAERGDLAHANECACPVTRGLTHVTIGYEVAPRRIDAETAINTRLNLDELEDLVNELKDQWKRSRAYNRMMERRAQREARP